ncbi:LysR family transcriptional regulator [Planotetraspora kaengkrachanensis]|uniref:LysR family transcriptional regulator n=1 Tax=Planotetraspora kaengkrachanensis TaxID=575193 RepID=A0A8J3LZ78_9ACTN|nr:LysR family transcriptional regulator [Planotetraspora kaengkrachanensis]GIG79445.1 LysR family transcriptional regulator [Planotetraspora kaengkrachanensis]
MELRELRAFVAVVEDGGLSAAARRLHVSQPALSQTISALERQLGVKLLVRSSTGVSPTEAGTTLLAEARAVLARHDQALRAMAAYSTEGAGVLRLGVPLELPTDLLGPALDRLAAVCPETRVQALHLSTAAQVAALRAGELDAGLLRERPGGPEFDAMLVVRENLGVLLSAEQAAEISCPDGIRLETLSGLEWLSFPRSGSPAWYDEVVAILRSHGVDIGPPAPEGQALIAEVKLAAVGTGKAFALAPPNWAQTLPDTVTWSPLIGNPLVRRTWAVWPAASRRRDLANLIAGFDEPGVS